MQLRLEDISFSYAVYEGAKNTGPLFEHLYLDAPSSSKVLVLGESGEGKTTLSQIISLLTPRYNAGSLEGSILFDGRKYESAGQLLDFYSLVPQNPADYFLTTAPEDEIASPLESLGLESGEIAKRVDEALETWDLMRYRQHPVSLLSGGEKKRLALATALATRPRLVVYDESFDDLDTIWRGRLMDWIDKTPETSIVTSSRFIPFFRGHFDAIYRLEGGRLEKIDEGQAMADSTFAFTRTAPTVQKKGKLSVEDLSFTRGDFRLSVPSFHLERGEVIYLSGANGSGKSTFSRILCALEKRQGGRVSIDDSAVDGKLLMRSVGYVFQNPDFQIFLPTVRDELSFSLDYLKLTRKEREERLGYLAELFGLDLDESALLMSFGKRKRLQCAIYYNLERPYYILDEIEAALPYSESARMVDLLSQRGAGVMLISHDGDFAKSLCTRGYRIEEGVLHEVL